jgi:hypothetical protein
MINVDNSDFHKKKRAVTAMRGAAMLLLLRRPLREVVTYCAFDKIRQPELAEKMREEQRLVSGRKELV